MGLQVMQRLLHIRHTDHQDLDDTPHNRELPQTARGCEATYITV